MRSRASARSHLGDQVEREVGLRVQQAQQDAVVVGLHLDLDARALAQRAGQGQAPRAVDPAAKGRVDHQPRIAERVLEDLDQDRAVGRDGPGVVELAGQIVQRVPGRERRPGRTPRPASPAAACTGGRLALFADLPEVLEAQFLPHLLQPLGHRAPERAHPVAQLVGPPGKSPRQKGMRGMAPGASATMTRSSVDVDHAPDLGAQHQRVADARLKDKLFVQFAQLGLAVAQIGAKGAGVGDGAAVGQGQPARAGQCGQLVVDAVPGEARRAVRGRPGWDSGPASISSVVEVDAPGQVVVGIGAAHAGRRAPPRPSLDRDHGHDLLRQHVQRLARRVRRLDLAAQHPAGDGRRLDHVLAVGGEDAPHAGLSHQVAGAAHALQALGHRLGRLELHDQVHRADVDAQFQGRGADQGRQLARLELAFQLQAGLFGDAAVVDADRAAVASPLAGGHHAHALDHAALDQARGFARGFGGDLLVEAVGRALGQAAVVGKDERGLVLADQRQHLGDDRGPDRVARAGCESRRPRVTTCRSSGFL